MKYLNVSHPLLAGMLALSVVAEPHVAEAADRGHAGGVPDLQRQIDELRQRLDGIDGSGDLTVMVNCPGDSINAVLAAAPVKGTLTIQILGVCNENVLVKRDDVILLGVSPQSSGIQGVPESSLIDESPLTIEGAQRVQVLNLTVSGGQSSGIVGTNARVTVANCVSENNGLNGITLVGGGFMQVDGCTLRNNARAGADVRNGGLLTLTNSTVEGNAGSGVNAQDNGTVFVGRDILGTVGPSTVSGNAGDGVLLLRSASGVVAGSTIENNAGIGVHANQGSSVTLAGNLVTAPRFALFVNNGSSAQVDGGNTLEAAAQQGFDGATVSAYRNSNLRVQGGGNVFRSTGASAASAACNSNLGSLALDVEMNSSMRNDGGHLSIFGDVESFNLSTVDLRDVDVHGVMFADGLNANIRLRDQGSVPGNVEVTGGICFFPPSVLSHRAIEVDGFVNCFGGGVNQSIIGGNPTYLNCN